MFGDLASKMAITFVNGTKNNATTNTTITGTYTPTAGNTVIVFLSVISSATNVTCKDNNNHFLTAGPTATNGTTHLFSFYMLGSNSGATSFICNWTTTGICSITVEEYSGVSLINAGLAGNSTTGTSAIASITVTTEDNNDWIVCGLVDAGNTLTASTGNSRQQVIAGTSARQILMDNTVVTAGSVTCSATLTSSAWAAVAIELRTLTPVFVQSAVGGATAGTSAIVTISPAAGNLVIIGVALLLTSDSVSSIVDSVGTTKYIFITAINNSTAARIELWAGFVIGAPTTITVNFATTTVEAVVAEYKNVKALGPFTSGITTGTTTILSLTTTDNNNYVVEVVAAGGNSTYSSGTGTLRNSGTQNVVIGCALADNTTTSANTSLSVSVTLGTSLANAEAIVELRSVPPIYIDTYQWVSAIPQVKIVSY